MIVHTIYATTVSFICFVQNNRRLFITIFIGQQCTFSYFINKDYIGYRLSLALPCVGRFKLLIMLMAASLEDLCSTSYTLYITAIIAKICQNMYIELATK